MRSSIHLLKQIKRELLQSSWHHRVSLDKHDLCKALIIVLRWQDMSNERMCTVWVVVDRKVTAECLQSSVMNVFINLNWINALGPFNVREKWIQSGGIWSLYFQYITTKLLHNLMLNKFQTTRSYYNILNLQTEHIPIKVNVIHGLRNFLPKQQHTLKIEYMMRRGSKNKKKRKLGNLLAS